MKYSFISFEGENIFPLVDGLHRKSAFAANRRATVILTAIFLRPL
jgi:hypothetical protein